MWTYLLALIPAYLFLYLPLSTHLPYLPTFDFASSTSSYPARPVATGPPFPPSFLADDLNSTASLPHVDLSLCTSPTGTGTSVQIIQTHPFLLLYLPSFLPSSTATHLLSVSSPLYAPSLTTTENGTSIAISKSIRDSEVASPPLEDEVVRCVHEKVRGMQGWRTDRRVERVRVQRYGKGGHYVRHWDWRGGVPSSGLAYGGWGMEGSQDRGRRKWGVWDRVSSMLVWVACDGDGGEGEEGKESRCGGGGTEFPKIWMGRGQRRELCERGWIVCDDSSDSGASDGEHGEHVKHSEHSEHGKHDPPEDGEEEETEGVTFLPIPGNALYWENLREDGSGIEETIHAGLPVTSGVKVGMNIWTWKEF